MSIGGWIAAREFDVQAQGITLRLRLPTVLQMRRIVAASDATAAALQEPLLAVCVVGWSGVPSSVIGDDGDELAFSSGALEAVLDRYTQAADKAFAELVDRYGKRRDEFEAAEKNS